MPIEFRCTQCGRLLRTPDETAGKQAKCPGCATLLTIPAAQPDPSVPPPFAGPAPGSPFGGPPAGGVNPYQSPAAYPAAYPPAPAAAGFQRSRLDFGDAFGRTFRIFGRQWGMCIVAALVLLLVWGAAFGGVVLLAALAGEAGGDEALVVVALFVAFIVAFAVGMWVTVGQAIFFLKVARGQEATIGDLFAGGRYYGTALAASVLVALIVIAGTLACYVPGVIFGLMFSQYLFLIVDRNAGATESLSLSKDVTDGNKLMLFAIQLVATLVAQAASYATCGLAMIVGMPLLMLLYAVVYLIMTGQPTADQAWMAPPPSPYGPPGTYGATGPYVPPGPPPMR